MLIVMIAHCATRIHFAEKGERREQNVADSAIKETVDTELRNED